LSKERNVKQEGHAGSDECAKCGCPILTGIHLIRVHAEIDPNGDTKGHYEADEKPQLDKRSKPERQSIFGLKLVVLLQIDAHLSKKKGYTRCDDYTHKRCLIFIRGSPPMHQVYTAKNARGNAHGYDKANEKLY
jgi:hypothetical protein